MNSVLIDSRTEFGLIWRYRDGLEVVRGFERILGVSLRCVKLRAPRNQQFDFCVKTKSSRSASLESKMKEKEF